MSMKGLRYIVKTNEGELFGPFDTVEAAASWIEQSSTMFAWSVLPLMDPAAFFREG